MYALLDRNLADRELESKTVWKLAEYENLNHEDALRRARLYKELSLIKGKNLSRLFLWTETFANELHLERAGDCYFTRGAVGSCLTTFLLGITKTDPVELDIPYITFLGASSHYPPDLALNVPVPFFVKAVRILRNILPQAGIRKGTVSDDLLNPLENDRIVKLHFLLPESYSPEKQDLYILFEREKTKLEITVLTEYKNGERNPTGTEFVISLIKHPTSDFLTMLKFATGESPSLKPQYDKAVVDRLFIRHEVGGLPELGNPFVKGIIDYCHPRTFQEFVKTISMAHGVLVYVENARDLIEDGRTLSEVVASRDDVFMVLTGEPYHLPEKIAYQIMMSTTRIDELTEEMVDAMEEHQVPDWLINHINKVAFAFPKAHSAEYAFADCLVAWYKYHHPGIFDFCYQIILRKRRDQIDPREDADYWKLFVDRIAAEEELYNIEKYPGYYNGGDDAEDFPFQ